MTPKSSMAHWWTAARVCLRLAFPARSPALWSACLARPDLAWFSNVLVTLAGGNLFALLIMTAIASTFLGMGMSTRWFI